MGQNSFIIQFWSKLNASRLMMMATGQTCFGQVDEWKEVCVLDQNILVVQILIEDVHGPI